MGNTFYPKLLTKLFREMIQIDMWKGIVVFICLCFVTFLYLRKKKNHGKFVTRENIQEVARLIQKNEDKIFMLTKKGVSLQNRMNQETEKAKAYERKNSRVMALNHLKRKKQLENQLSLLMAQKNEMESLNLRLQEQLTNLELFEAQREGKELMEEMLKEIEGAEHIQDTMDDLKKGMEEVSQALSEDLGETMKGVGMDVISPSSEKKVEDDGEVETDEVLDKKLQTELDALMEDLN